MDLSKMSCNLFDRWFPENPIIYISYAKISFYFQTGHRIRLFFHSKIRFLLFNQNVNQNLIRLILDIVDSDNDAAGAVIAADSVRII